MIRGKLTKIGKGITYLCGERANIKLDGEIVTIKAVLPSVETAKEFYDNITHQPFFH